MESDILDEKGMTSKKGKLEVLEIHECLLGDRQKFSVHNAAIELCNFMESKARKHGENILKETWPALIDSGGFEWKKKPVLELQPLNRVGGEPGKSGVSVLAGHFYFSAAKSIPPSRQMIIKISPDLNDGEKFARDKKKELIEEFNTTKTHKNKFKSRQYFARPLWLYETSDNEPAVLWAPFESPEPMYVLKGVEKNTRWQFAPVLEMVKYLSAAWASSKYQEDSEIRKNKLDLIASALNYLSETHSGGCRTKVNLIKHYSWELRGFMKPQDNAWATKWHNLWGDQKEWIDDFEKKWRNPIAVLNTISESGPFSIKVGHVHGDLHPRNIVFSGDNEVRIIDFGWARPQKAKEPLQHVIKDFVLLEANLRFMTLPPFLPYGSVTSFLDWIGRKGAPQKNIDDECKLRIELIKKIRETAQNHVGNFQNWDIEYVVPLFLVSLGLLKHCHNADCTWAARYTVLALAKHLRKTFK